MNNQFWMNVAIQEAKKAYLENEIPIGAVLTNYNDFTFRDHNRTKQTNNPLAHAEKLVIEQALKEGFYYLQNFTLFVTIEPCSMCAGIAIWSRIDRIVYGSSDLKAGACGSIINLPQDTRMNHQPEIVRGILAKECKDLIQKFFLTKRMKS